MRRISSAALEADVLVLGQIGKRRGADAGHAKQISLFEFSVNQLIPEFFITDSHKTFSFIPIYKKCSAARQSTRSIAAILPRPIPTPDSVVYYDSTFSQTKQENDKFE